MAFHHDKDGHAHFGASKGGGPMHPQKGQVPVHHSPKGHGAEEQHGTPPQHVEETHPGETTPHPETGIHAFHAHHVDGGHSYVSHTHHGASHPKGRHVETRTHDSHEDMLAAHHEAFPPQEEADEEHEGAADGTEYADLLGGGVGGQSENG